MTDLRKAAEAVLEMWGWDWSEPRNEALRERMEALRQALAQPEHEPVAWVECAVIPWLQSKDTNVYAMTKLHRIPNEHYDTPLYTTPSNREWVGLTDAEVESWRGNYDFFDSQLVREVEAKLKEKNGG